MLDQRVVDHLQVELFSPAESLSRAGLKLIGLLPLTGGELYGTFGSTSRGSLTSLPSPVVPALYRSTWCTPEDFASESWWASLPAWGSRDLEEDLWQEGEEGE